MGMADTAGVRDLTVVVREDQCGERRLVAYVTLDPQTSLDIERIRTVVRANLPAHMVPTAFVVLDKLPLTANGKIDQDALPAPGMEAYRFTNFEIPKGDIENALATIWAELLRVDQVGRDDDFFDLGGHSMLASILSRRIEDLWGVSLGVGNLFESKTIRSIAEAVERAQLIAVESSAGGASSAP
jgi:hypothetical protein